MATQVQDDQAKPTFVFKGTVRNVNAATMPDVPVSKSTAIVTVDEIINGPTDLTGFLGQEITVRVNHSQGLRAGQKLIFHTVGWIFGSGVAVRSLREEPIVNTRSQTERAGHYRDADLVVRGKVVRVQLPKQATVARSKQKALPITEHAPLWHEAIIQVQEVLKGDEQTKRVTVCFPDSSDVMFHGAPRFEPGQQGYFMLHKMEAAKQPGVSRTADAARNERPDTYFALDSQDFRPLEK
ncbi:MAG TPA: hypothetical protein VE863_22730 [Pyrinomonadaceae bacterium]|nr:hypothetical protein [Pyrinomonadaceae bacterium]